MQLKAHHISAIALGAVLLIGASATYGLRSKAAPNTLPESSQKINFTGDAFVGKPESWEDLNNCRVLGKGKTKTSGEYVLREEVPDLKTVSGVREMYCFATEADAQAKGFVHAQ